MAFQGNGIRILNLRIAKERQEDFFPEKKKLSAFLTTLFSSIKIYVAFAFCCSFQFSEQEILSYFQNLIRTRGNAFLKAHKQKKHPQQTRKENRFLFT